MYLKSLDSSTSDAKPSNGDVLSWVDQAYKMLKQQKVCNFFKITHTDGIIQTKLNSSASLCIISLAQACFTT